MSEPTILLVEDNPGDARLIERAFEERRLPGELHTVRTGDEALDWFHRRDDFTDAPRPDLVLLDLNLPSTSGQTVLETIKSDARSKRTPVIVLTGSQSEADLVEAYEGHANACLTKPVDPDEFADLVELFAEFWAATVVLPPRSEPTAER